ncbi:MAG: MFS transporter [Anaerolineae bacterium]|nr:MFS transporter [Anaerolineae bacterium]
MKLQRIGDHSLLLVAFANYVVMALPLGMLNIAWSFMQDDFGLALDSLGVLLSIMTIGRLLSAFLNGPLIARWGVGKVLLSGSVLVMVGTTTFALAPTWPLLLACNFLVGIGNGFLDPALNTYVSAHYRASRLNWLHGFFGVGLTLGPLLVTLMVIDSGLSWRWCYGLVAGLQLGILLSLLITRNRWLLNDVETETHSEDVMAGRKPRIQDTLRLPVVWFTLVIVAIYGSIEVGGGQLINSLFTGARDIDVRLSSYWISIYWMCFTIGRMLMGGLVDRIGVRTLLRLGMVGAMIGTACVWSRALPWVNFAGLALLGFSLAPLFPSLISVTPQRVGLRHAPNTIGFQIGMTGVGGAVLTGLGAVLATQLGLEVIGPYLFGMAAALFVLHEWLLMRETRLLLARKI